MKTLLIIIGLSLFTMGWGQDAIVIIKESKPPTSIEYSESLSTGIWIETDTCLIDSTICNERGHVMSGMMTTTLLYRPSYIVDYEDYSEEVFPACNSTSGACARCGLTVTKPGEEIRVVIWRRED